MSLSLILPIRHVGHVLRTRNCLKAAQAVL